MIPTTRSQEKGDDTVSRLNRHLQNELRKADRSLPGISKLLEPRVRFEAEILDLCSLVSVRKLVLRLYASPLRKLDAVVLNAGIGGWTGIDWGMAIWTILTDWVHATTWPLYKKSGVGWVAKQQVQFTISDNGKETERNRPEEPALGEIFLSNVFGHYLLAHYVAPLLSNGNGRIIWLSSLDTYARSLDFNDFQAIRSSSPYESSKRITDLLALTSRHPATAPFIRTYLHPRIPCHPSPSTNAGLATHQPKIYVAQPGICATSIFPLPLILTYAMNIAFYIARYLGSPWHTCTAYLGACAPVWLVLASQELLDDLDEKQGVSKWGSGTSRWGEGRVKRTEVEGWGFGGRVGEGREKGGLRGSSGATERDVERFLEDGRECWQEMERLRHEWERILGDRGFESKDVTGA